MTSVLSMLRIDSEHISTPKVACLGCAPDDVRRLSPGVEAEYLAVDADSNWIQVQEDDWGCLVVRSAVLDSRLAATARSFVAAHPAFTWIVWCDHADIGLAIEVMKCGAVDVVRHAQDDALLSAALKTALDQAHDRFSQTARRRNILGRFGQLSQDEKCVLAMILAGRTNKEIAKLLEWSLRTIEARRQRILNVMHASNAIELAVILAQNSLMDEVAKANPELPAEEQRAATA